MIINKSILKNPLAEGGEAFVYDINGRIIKIFKSVGVKEEKIKSMIGYKFPSCVIAPEELVYDNSGKFLGYAMRKVRGEEVKMLAKKKFCDVNGITTRQIVDILINIKNALEQIHFTGVVIGDLNDSNILFDNTNIYFIDVDSWDIPQYPCVVCMDGFKDAFMSGVKFTKETDSFAFSVLAFKILTRIHPYGGTMGTIDNMMDRMQKKISIIGNESRVTVPKNCLSYKYLGNVLTDEFNKIFNAGERFLLHMGLTDFKGNNKECANDKIYYYGAFTACPICDSSATIRVAPASVGKEIAPHLVLIWQDIDKIIVSPNLCVDTQLVYDINTMSSVVFEKFVHYLLFDNSIISYTDSEINIITSRLRTKITNKLPRSSVSVVGNEIYFINTNCKMCCATLTGVVSSPIGVRELYAVSMNTKFEYYSKDKYCVINDYDNCKIVNVNGANITFNTLDKIDDYGIHYDNVMDEWLVMWRTPAGKCVMYILQNNQIKYETNKINITCPMGNVAYNSGTLFIPEDNNIKAFNHRKNIYKDFICDHVTGDSNLVKDDKYIYIYNQNEILRMG